MTVRRSTWKAVVTVGAVTAAVGFVSPLASQSQPAPQTSSARRISVTWQETPIRDVLLAFAAFSGRSIVAGEGVAGFVTADINDQPWDVALNTILSGRGLVGTENEHGIILVEDMGTLDADEAIAPIITRTYRISFVPVAEIQAALTPLLSERGSISVSPSTNSVIVSDIERVHRAIAGTLR
jgi:type IV pilus assembly protein PilQ